jgi:hypothetical protein
MRIESPASRICLLGRETLRLTRGKGETIVCRTGAVWITVDHDRRDTILEPGQSFTLDSDESVLVHAFEASTVGVIASPRPAPRAWGSAWGWRTPLARLARRVAERLVAGSGRRLAGRTG